MFSISSCRDSFYHVGRSKHLSCLDGDARSCVSTGRGILIFLGLIFSWQAAFAQACCSGGTPLSGSLGLQRMAAGSALVELTYDYNTQHDLISGSTRLDNNPRRRNTHSMLLRGVYALNDRFSLFGILSFIRQEEVIMRQSGERGIKQAAGFGDAVLFGQYSLVDRPALDLLLGAGVQIPVGSVGHIDNETGLPLNPDLQPGTGSWDGLLGARLSIYHVFKQNLSFTSNITYRLTTPADRYAGRQRYEFGDELRWLTGFSDQFLIGTGIVTPSILVMYRRTQADKTNDFATPNTGGHWLHLRPGLGYAFSPRLNLNVFGEIPLYRQLEGTQLTTSTRFRISMAYAFPGKQQLGLQLK